MLGAFCDEPFVLLALAKVEARLEVLPPLHSLSASPASENQGWQNHQHQSAQFGFCVCPQAEQ